MCRRVVAPRGNDELGSGAGLAVLDFVCSDVVQCLGHLHTDIFFLAHQQSVGERVNVVALSLFLQPRQLSL